MEALLNFFFTKDAVNKSKVISVLSFIFKLIMASWLFTQIIGKFYILDITDPTQLINYFISGYFIPAILIYGLVLISSILIILFLAFLHRLYFHPKIVKKVLSNNFAFSTEDVLQRPFNIESFRITQQVSIKEFMVKFGLLQVKDNTLLIDQDFYTLLKKYFNEPQSLSMNCIRLVIFSIEFTVAYFIVNSFVELPFALNFLVVVLFVIIEIILMFFIRDASRLEVFAPSFAKLNWKAKQIETIS